MGDSAWDTQLGWVRAKVKGYDLCNGLVLPFVWGRPWLHIGDPC